MKLFLLWVHRSWLGMAQRWSILDQQWLDMAGLSTFQSGPKESKMVNITVSTIWDHFWPIWTLLNNFRLKMIVLPQKDKVGFSKHHWFTKFSGKDVTKWIQYDSYMDLLYNSDFLHFSDAWSKGLFPSFIFLLHLDLTTSQRVKEECSLHRIGRSSS